VITNVTDGQTDRQTDNLS